MMPAVAVSTTEELAKKVVVALARHIRPDVDEAELLRRLKADWPLVSLKDLDLLIHFVGPEGGAHGNRLVVVRYRDVRFGEWGQKFIEEKLANVGLFEDGDKKLVQTATRGG